MIPVVDAFLNRTTMYRLVVYHLVALLLAGLIASAFGYLAFSPIVLTASTLYLIAINWIANRLLSALFAAPTNIESVYITALILALIVTPPTTIAGYVFLTWVSIWAMASKYLITIHKKHFFNPAAIAIAITAATTGQAASWWVGTASLLPIAAIGGWLIARKLRQTAIVTLMCLAALIGIGIYTAINGFDITTAILKTFTDTPLIFFATVMFTEPLTMPPTRSLQIVYAALVGFLFAPQNHIGSTYSTPELALLVGNVYSYLVSPKIRRVLQLVKKTQLTSDVYDFAFAGDTPFAFEPGQYMEWTLPHSHADTRGNRRYFTLASSPNEKQLHLGIKFYPQASTFKQALANLQPGQSIVASQIDGDFTLPKDPTKPCVFIAGGIGVTPFHSMIKHLLDTQESRSITMFYAARTPNDFAYWQTFERARKELGINTVYVPSDPKSLPADWQGESGLITPDLIKKYVPDYTSPIFYISGPRSMVDAFKQNLRQLGVPRRHIKTDFFPGFV